MQDDYGADGSRMTRRYTLRGQPSKSLTKQDSIISIDNNANSSVQEHQEKNYFATKTS